MYRNYYKNAFNQNPNDIISPFQNPRMGDLDIMNMKKPMNLSRSLSRVEKGIDTISSFIPLYQKVKPVIENSKDFVNLIKKKLNKTTKSKKKVEKVDVEIVNENKQADDDILKEETKPNNPYF